MSALLTKDQINDNLMGGACGTYGVQERCMHGFGVGDQWRSDPLEDRYRWEDDIKMYLE
jgi:hypothetical protein